MTTNWLILKKDCTGTSGREESFERAIAEMARIAETPFYRVSEGAKFYAGNEISASPVDVTKEVRDAMKREYPAVTA